MKATPLQQQAVNIANYPVLENHTCRISIISLDNGISCDNCESITISQTSPTTQRMKLIHLSAALLSYLTLLASTGLSLSQAEIEIRKAQPSPDAPMVEVVPRAVPSSPKVANSTAAAQAATAAPAASSHRGNTYKLRANDQLEIRVFGHADLSGVTTVREDGTVRLQLINELVQVGGQTLESVETRIRSLLAKDYLRDPRVSVNISRHAMMKITVLGKVNQPKTYGVPSNQPINLVQAIGLAGGKSNLGNLGKVYLKRGAKVEVYDVNEMLRKTDAPSPMLQDGDIVEVPESLF